MATIFRSLFVHDAYGNARAAGLIAASASRASVAATFSLLFGAGQVGAHLERFS